jgi:hypothetical protein
MTPPTPCHLERSATKPKDPTNEVINRPMGSFDVAQDDIKWDFRPLPPCVILSVAKNLNVSAWSSRFFADAQNDTRGSNSTHFLLVISSNAEKSLPKATVG